MTKNEIPISRIVIPGNRVGYCNSEILSDLTGPPFVGEAAKERTTIESINKSGTAVIACHWMTHAVYLIFMENKWLFSNNNNLLVDQKSN